MYIEVLKDEEEKEKKISSGCDEKLGLLDAKRVAIGVGARVLFHPTLLYNVIRNKMQAEFRWWDEVDEFLLLGAVPFPSDVSCLKQIGVCGIITLNEPMRHWCLLHCTLLMRLNLW